MAACTMFKDFKQALSKMGEEDGEASWYAQLFSGLVRTIEGAYNAYTG